MVHSLLLLGAYPYSVTRNLQNVLHLAVAQSNRSVVSHCKRTPRRDLTPSTDSPRFLLCCILFFSVHQVRLLVRYDAEKRLLKQGKDASMKRPADVAPDQRTRNSLMSLWEACEDGKLEITRKMLLVSGRIWGITL